MTFLHELHVEVPLIRFLNPDGTLSSNCPEILLEDNFLERAYRHLWLTRRFDQRAVALQRTGRLGTYASCLGQEAVGTGIGLAMDDQDLFAPYYRDQATQLLRGVDMLDLLKFWGGMESGNDFARARHDLPNCIPIATQITHAAGMATALKIRQQHQAVLTTCGDGATSRGDFYEPLNLAGIWYLPLVLVINNNQWAISVPRGRQTGAATLAQKAVAAGIPGIQVDGNDVLAVQFLVAEALDRARKGKGPSLIEAVTYRLCDHTTADDMRRYCPAERLEQAWKEEPITRLRRLMEQRHIWNEDREVALQQEHEQQISNVVNTYLSLPQPDPMSMFSWLYAQIPDELQAQRMELQRRRLAP